MNVPTSTGDILAPDWDSPTSSTTKPWYRAASILHSSTGVLTSTAPARLLSITATCLWAHLPAPVQVVTRLLLAVGIRTLCPTRQLRPLARALGTAPRSTPSARTTVSLHTPSNGT